MLRPSSACLPDELVFSGCYKLPPFSRGGVCHTHPLGANSRACLHGFPVSEALFIRVRKMLGMWRGRFYPPPLYTSDGWPGLTAVELVLTRATKRDDDLGRLVIPEGLLDRLSVCLSK